MSRAEDDVIGAIYEASTDASRWGQAMRALGHHLHCAAGGLNSEAHVDTQSVVGLDAIYGYSSTALADYVEYFCAANPFNRPPRKFRLGEVISDAQLERRVDLGRRFDELEYYRDWARPQGLRYVLGQYVEGAESERLIAAFWRPPDAGPYSAAEVALFDRAMRHTRRARDVGARLADARRQMEAVADRLPAAILTLGRDGRLRQANGVANALLAAGVALTSEGGRLRTAIAQDQAALDRLIAFALDPRLLRLAEEARIFLRRSGGLPPLTVRAFAVLHRFDPFAPDRSASVVLTVEGAMETGREEDFSARLGFSPAEARVAAEMLAGRSPGQAAAALGLSVATIRSHLKKLYARTGTSGQRELVLFLNRHTTR